MHRGKWPGEGAQEESCSGCLSAVPGLVFAYRSGLIGDSSTGPGEITGAAGASSSWHAINQPVFGDRAWLRLCHQHGPQSCLRIPPVLLPPMEHSWMPGLSQLHKFCLHFFITVSQILSLPVPTSTKLRAQCWKSSPGSSRLGQHSSFS